MEELKGQLAERMPGVISAMAEAGGYKDQAALFKAMENGEVKALDVLEKFSEILAKRAREGDALAKAMESSMAAQDRFNNSWTKFVTIMGDNGLDQGFAKIFDSFSKFLKDNPKLAEGMAEAVLKLANGIEKTSEGLTSLIKGFQQLSNSLGVGATDLAMYSAGALMLATTFGRIAAFAYAFFLVLEDIAVGMRGGDSYTKDFLDFLDANAWAEVTVKVAAFAGSLMLVANALGKIGVGIGLIGGAKGAVGGGGLAGMILNIITKHPIMAALIAATAALNIAHEVYESRADKHLKGVIARTQNPVVAEELKHLSSGGLALKDIARNNMDYYRDFPSGSLPGINQPMMMVDKISIEVSGSKNPQDVANAVLERIKLEMHKTSQSMGVNE